MSLTLTSPIQYADHSSSKSKSCKSPPYRGFSTVKKNSCPQELEIHKLPPTSKAGAKKKLPLIEDKAALWRYYKKVIAGQQVMHVGDLEATAFFDKWKKVTKKQYDKNDDLFHELQLGIRASICRRIHRSS